MQIKQLISFVTVARTKNMAQTALALNYSHSTIFGHLESLEKEFNTKLYYRTSRGIELTSKGEILLQYAQQFVALYEEACSTLSESQQNRLRVGASESGDVCFMHDILQEYIRIVPKVEIEYTKMTSDVSVSKLVAGTCDVAIICEYNFHPEGLYSRYLCTLPLIFVSSPSFLSLIGSSGDGLLPTLLGTMKLPVAEQMLQSVGLDFHSCFSSLSNIGDLDTIKHLLLYNQGVALLPLMYVEPDLEAGALVQLPDMPQQPSLDAYVVTPSKSRIGPRTKEFIDLTFRKYNPNFLESENIIPSKADLPEPVSVSKQASP